MKSMKKLNCTFFPDICSTLNSYISKPLQSPNVKAISENNEHHIS